MRKPSFVLLASVLAFAPVAAEAQQKLRAIPASDARQAQQQHPAVVAEFGGTMSGPLADYVQGVGRRVAAQSNLRGGANAVTFTTLNSPVMNAFAVPGGYVYVTRQLMALAEDEAELALILGHETGHIAANHSQKRQTSNVLSQIGAAVVGIISGSSGLGQLAGQVGQGIVLGYSRGQENESDQLGVRYMAAAGYDTRAAAGMLGSLGDWDALQSRLSGAGQRSTPGWARTHPLSSDRVARVNKLAASAQPTPGGDRGRDRHLAAIDGMIFDDDPRQGVVEGDRFLHPELRLSFIAPRGYAIQNGARTVTIAGSGGQAQFSSGASSGSLDAYIGQVFQSLNGGRSALRIPPAERTNVNGIPAAYTTTRASTQNGQIDVTVFAYQWNANTAYHFVTMTRAGLGLGPFGSMVGSIDRLSAAEASAIRPRVIDIVTVRPSDTIRSLADRMAYPDYRVERFLTLNSLTPESALRPGEKVKLVVFDR